jgi:predicted transcriptional regulator
MIPVCYHSGMAMTLRLTDEDEQALTLLAEAQGISKQEATVRAIRDAAARRVHEDRVRELSAQARARYAEVLERLGR